MKIDVEALRLDEFDISKAIAEAPGTESPYVAVADAALRKAVAGIVEKLRAMKDGPISGDGIIGPLHGAGIKLGLDMCHDSIKEMLYEAGLEPWPSRSEPE